MFFSYQCALYEAAEAVEKEPFSFGNEKRKKRKEYLRLLPRFMYVYESKIGVDRSKILEKIIPKR